MDEQTQDIIHLHLFILKLHAAEPFMLFISVLLITREPVQTKSECKRLCPSLHVLSALYKTFTLGGNMHLYASTIKSLMCTTQACHQIILATNQVLAFSVFQLTILGVKKDIVQPPAKSLLSAAESGTEKSLFKTHQANYYISN